MSSRLTFGAGIALAKYCEQLEFDKNPFTTTTKKPIEVADRKRKMDSILNELSQDVNEAFALLPDSLLEKALERIFSDCVTLHEANDPAQFLIIGILSRL